MAGMRPDKGPGGVVTLLPQASTPNHGVNLGPCRIPTGTKERCI